MYSPKAAGLAEEMGYNNVMIYREGIMGWAKSGCPTTSLRKYPPVEIPILSARELNETDPTSLLIVDTRPLYHFSNGHVPGCKNVDLEVLHEQLNQLPRDKRIVLVDHKGKTTLTTGRFLVSEGFRNVARLDGGFNAWVKAGLPVEQ